MNLHKPYYENFDYIAFIDIDGVLNNEYFKGEYKFLEESIEVLNYLYEKYNLKLVLSSSWRHAYSFNFLQVLFKENNIKAPLIDKTYICFPEVEKKCDSVSLYDLMTKSDEELQINNLYKRDNEIKEWIKMFKPKHYVILDDFLIKDKLLSKHQILTNNYGPDETKLGLRKFHLETIEKILKIEED